MTDLVTDAVQVNRGQSSPASKPDNQGNNTNLVFTVVRENWITAHERAQEHDDTADMRLHAYLHRKEGDQSNPEYWYRRCGAAPSILTLHEEWEQLAQGLLEQG
ncbi:hypothetical protein [Sinorhizobium fredii]|uniref:hypothetical protein n=1 Tax=Rhizobium fredii TaxID=380 RepID=UPI003517B106